MADESGAWEALDDHLAAVYRHARSSLPQFLIDENTFRGFVAERCDRLPADFLDAIDAAELYLVLGCLRGERAALDVFDSTYLAEVPNGVRRLGCDASEIADVRQEVGRQLLVGGANAKLRAVCGRGDLRALIRLMAYRAAISLRRKSGREMPTNDGVLELAFEGELPTMQLAKAEHRALLSRALEAALASLEPTRRAVLKLHCLDGIGLEALATMHGVDRSTISRWIARARSDVAAATQRQLAALGVPRGHFDSFVDVIRSNFELSLQRMLQPTSSDA